MGQEHRLELSAGGAGAPEVEVRRSARRKRTVTAYREGGRVVVLMPARFTRSEEQRWVRDMLDRLERREQRDRSGAARSDAALAERADSLSRRYLGGRAEPATIRWVDNMASRWGSCTITDRTIRLSSRLREMPAWVVDYVIVHELAHLLVADHNERFWSLVDRYPRTDRARGFLEGYVAAVQQGSGQPVPPGELDPPEDVDTPAGDLTPDPGRLPRLSPAPVTDPRRGTRAGRGGDQTAASRKPRRDGSTARADRLW